jgi:ABC-2 type transport system permease protein
MTEMAIPLAVPAPSVSCAAFIAFYGRLNGSSLGELVTWRSGFVPIVVGVISLLTVIRHTRTEEESGRRELLGATVVGRNAGLAAALGVTFFADLLFAAFLTLGADVPAPPRRRVARPCARDGCVGLIFAAVGAVEVEFDPDASANCSRARPCGRGFYTHRGFGTLSPTRGRGGQGGR